MFWKTMLHLQSRIFILWWKSNFITLDSLTELWRLLYQSKRIIFFFCNTNFKVANTNGQSPKHLLNELKIHVRLFLQTYISTQIRNCKMSEFFSYETQKHPLALLKCSQMRSGNKSDLVNCIEEIPNEWIDIIF